MIRLYSKDDEDRGPLKDGETLHIPLMLMDAGWGRDPIIERDARDAADDDQVDDEFEKREQRYDARCRKMQDAWRQPALSPTQGVERTKERYVPKFPTDAAEARRLAHEAWQRRLEWLKNAWKEGR